MRQGNVEKSLRREVYKAIWEGCSFTPPIIYPDPDTGV
jgi:hypothetical protein